MASSAKPLVQTKFARGAINPLSFVKLDHTSPSSAKNAGIVQCGLNDSPYGIAQNESAAASGDEVEVSIIGGGGRLKLGGASGTVVEGQSLKSDASGYGIPAATAGDRVGAQAVEGGVAGDYIGVHVNRFEKYNSDAT